MYAYDYVSLYTYILTDIFHWKELMLINAICFPVPTTLSPCIPRSYDVGTTSMPFL